MLTFSQWTVSGASRKHSGVSCLLFLCNCFNLLLPLWLSLLPGSSPSFSSRLCGAVVTCCYILNTNTCFTVLVNLCEYQNISRYFLCSFLIINNKTSMLCIICESFVVITIIFYGIYLTFCCYYSGPSVLWLCWSCDRKGIWLVESTATSEETGIIFGNAIYVFYKPHTLPVDVVPFLSPVHVHGTIYLRSLPHHHCCRLSNE